MLIAEDLLLLLLAPPGGAHSFTLGVLALPG